MTPEEELKEKVCVMHQNNQSRIKNRDSHPSKSYLKLGLYNWYLSSKFIFVHVQLDSMQFGIGVCSLTVLRYTLHTQQGETQAQFTFHCKNMIRLWS